MVINLSIHFLVNDHCISNCNALEIKFEFRNIFYYCTGIYRSPCIDQISFISSLQSNLDNFDDKDVPINIIGGDINIDTNKNNTNSLDYSNLLANYQFIPCITDYTRVTDRIKTCIDHIFVQNINCQNLKPVNNLIRNENWSESLNKSNVNISLDVFNDKINEYIKSATKPISSKLTKNKRKHKISITKLEVKFLIKQNVRFLILKETCKSISLPLKIIYNQSLLTGTYPTNFKTTLIAPLYKFGDIELCKNFKPISLSLSLTISKIFEKCLKHRLVKFLNKHTSNKIHSKLDKGNVLSPRQILRYLAFTMWFTMGARIIAENISAEPYFSRKIFQPKYNWLDK
ncbi:putative RNA-directed DNA polymerase [Aphis craccivora]|uniref:Putative RNA-directed DNA polymerase n=1 Tax=Aphis craccivora TaxID=307492 RepID=A0A6G0YCY8_APHCR|nr:putative RNA-directed DNA polymerase [Aphis craccivora]